MLFTEFHVGQKFALGPIHVTEAEILAFARAWDPQWFHTDPERAEQGRWKGLIASGWHTCSLAMRAVVEGPLRDSGSIGSPGLAYLKWTAPVRPDDRLTVNLEVLEIGYSASGRIGSVRWCWRVVNQDGVQVLDTEASSLFELVPAKPA